jgi:hypothetical protein
MGPRFSFPGLFPRPLAPAHSLLSRRSLKETGLCPGTECPGRELLASPRQPGQISRRKELGAATEEPAVRL